MIKGQLVLVEPEEIIEGETYWITEHLKVMIVKNQPLSKVVQCADPSDLSQTIRVSKEKLRIPKLKIERPYTHKLVINEKMEGSIEAIR